MVTGLMAPNPSPTEEIKSLILSDLLLIDWMWDRLELGIFCLALRARGTRGTPGGHNPTPEEHLSLNKKAFPTGGVTPSTAENTQRRCELHLNRVVKYKT